MTCLVLRGEEVDREILISCAMLKKWDMIHQTFPAQTLSDYIRNLDRKISNVYDSNKCFEIYEKSHVTTKEKLSKTSRQCNKLREYILQKYLDPGDRVNIPPVHLEVDESRGVSPVQATKAFDIPHHLMKPETTEINEMLRSGVLTKKL